MKVCTALYIVYVVLFISLFRYFIELVKTVNLDFRAGLRDQLEVWGLVRCEIEVLYECVYHYAAAHHSLDPFQSQVYRIFGHTVVFYPTDSLVDFYTSYDVMTLIDTFKVV